MDSFMFYPYNEFQLRRKLPGPKTAENAFFGPGNFAILVFMNGALIQNQNTELVCANRGKKDMIIWNGSSFFHPVDGVKAKFNGLDWKVVGAIKTTATKVLLEHPQSGERKEAMLFGGCVKIETEKLRVVEAVAERRGGTRPRDIRPRGQYSKLSKKASSL
jgi:hypothetical protein